MFQGSGRSSIPKPAPRNLEDLDSVQRVLLHRSVWLTGCNQAGLRGGVRLGAGLLSSSWVQRLKPSTNRLREALKGTNYKKLNCLSSESVCTFLKWVGWKLGALPELCE